MSGLRLAAAASRWLVAAALLTGALVAVAVAGATRTPAQAADASKFNAGYIISDANFYNSASMSAAEIQLFLNSKGSACTTGGERPCLKNYHTATRAWAAEPGLCNGYAADPDQTAAEVIAGVAQSCGISPQVLLVTLQKETGLVRSTAPSNRSYEIAMGFGCPDFQACNTEYYGFFNQVYRAARQFKVYKANATRYGYQAGRSNYIQYNPNKACGGSNVYIQNQATAALYIYTPYQPNAAALANLYRVGDSCSTYGNRNFWSYYTDWFGDPTGNGYASVGGFYQAPGDPAIWLVSSGLKEHVPSMAVLDAYGGVAKVSSADAATLNSLPRGPDLGFVVRAPETGGIYFVSATGTFSRVTSCEILADYGYSCIGQPAMSQNLVDGYPQGGVVTSFARTTSDPAVYLVTDGVKQHVVDGAAMAAWGGTSKVSVLGDGFLAGLSSGASLSTSVKIPDSGNYYLATGAKISWAPSCELLVDYGGSCDQTPIMSPGVANTYTRTAALAPFAKTADNPSVYLVTDGTKQHLANGAVWNAYGNPSIAVLPSDVLSRLTDGPALNTTVKVPETNSLYVASGSGLQAFASCDVAVDFGMNCSGDYPIMSGGVASTMSKGSTIGSFVKSATGPDVYLVTDGVKFHVANGAVMAAFGGFGRVTVVNGALLSSLTDGPALNFGVTVAETGTTFVASGGTLHEFASCDVAADFGYPCTGTYPVMSQSVADGYTKGTTVGPMVKPTSDAAVYLITDGTKQHITSGATVSAFGGWSHVAYVDPGLLAGMASGADAGQMVLDPHSGAVYYIESSTAHHVTSCSAVARYGYSCSALPMMSAGVISGFTAGADIS